MKYKLVSFDFDHTLTRGITAAEHLAEYLGVAPEIAKHGDAFRLGKMTTAEFADATAHYLSGKQVRMVTDHIESIPLVAGVTELISWLRGRKFRVVLNTIGYRDILLPLAAKLGFDDVSGVELEHDTRKFTGRVTKYFPLEEKIEFARRQALAAQGTLGDVIAVGDGLSDVPLFNAVGASIAFNADASTNEIANFVARGETCDELYDAFESFL